MNAKQKISIVALAGVVMAVCYWTGYVHGSSSMTGRDLIASLVLPPIFILTLATLTFALFFRRGSLPPSGGGSPPPTALPRGVPAPRPPGAPPEIHCEHPA